MPRFSPALAALAAALFAPVAFAQQPPRAVTDAIAVAKLRLSEGRATDAVLVLEKQLAFADGDEEFRDTLRAAYAAELKQLTDPKAIDAARKNLALLGGASPAEVAPPLPVPLPPSGALPPPSGAEAPPAFPTDTPLPPPAAPKPVAPPAPDTGGIDLLKQATAVFNLARSEPAKFGEARDLFGLAFNKKRTMSAEQMTAWAYCRLKVATDTLNRSNDAQTAAELVGEIEDALAIAPDHAGLQNAGRDVLAAAKKRAGSLPTKRPTAVVDGDWEVLDTDNFRVKYRGKVGVAESVARTAEEKRGAIFAKWSAAPGRKWQPKCEIMIHPDADLFTALKLQFPERVHLLMGNHELSQWTGRPVMKNDADLNALFEDGVTAAYGPEKGEAVYAGYLRLFGVLPLALRTANRVFLSHSLPRARALERFDLRHLETDAFPPEDLTAGGSVYELLWGRDTKPDHSRAFLDKVNADWLVTGHIAFDAGYSFPSAHHLIVDCCSSPAAFAHLSTTAPLTAETFRASLRVVGAE